MLLAVVPRAQAAPTELFFSEYVEGSSFNKAVEVYNGTGAPVDLAAGAYSVQIFFNGSASAGQTINLTASVAPGEVFVLAHRDAAAAIEASQDQESANLNFNGDDAVVLRKGDTVIDVIGQIGFDPGSEWGTGEASTQDNTLRRKPLVEAGDPDGSDPFDPAAQWDGFPTDSFAGLGEYSTPTPSVACGSGLTTAAGTAATTTVTARDPNGTVSDISITGVDPAPSAGGISVARREPATAAGGTARADVTVDAATPPATYRVELTATTNDSPPETGRCTLTVNVLSIRPIGAVQGAVGDSADGATHRSPFAPPSGNGAGSETVAVQGVVTHKTLARTGNGGSLNGFFLENTSATDDDDPSTADGIFVFTSGFPTLIGGYAPRVGDEVVLTARVTEFFNLTELTSARLSRVVRSGVDPAIETPPFSTDPPDDSEHAERYWERREGMRGRVPPASVVLNGRNVFPNTQDGEVWLARADEPIARRPDPYARRTFRDPHPLDNRPDELFDDGNGYRIVLGSLGLKATAGRNTELIAPARTFDTVTNSPTGGVYFSFGKYQLQVEEQLELARGADPAANAPPQRPERPEEYGIANYNVENLYDFRDDPFDGCDFAGNPGCPGVTPPFDYVPGSEAAYRGRLSEIAAQIRDELHAPELILVQEAEDQDICTRNGGGLACGDRDNADGRPDTLQELALAIAARGGPEYEAALDRDGADDRGIVSAFMYRTDRVELVPPAAGDPVLGTSPRVEYRTPGFDYNRQRQNPKALNAPLPSDVDTTTPPGAGRDGDDVYTKPPQVGHFRVRRSAGDAAPALELYALSNHFSSIPDQRVGQRKEQAAYNAAIIAAIQSADSGARVLTGGDFNVYPRPDDPFPPSTSPSRRDQLGALYDRGLTNLFDVLVAEAPASAYSYVFQGQAQTLDHQVVSPSLRSELRQSRVAHLNSDFPADFADDGARGVSDHDPILSRFRSAAAPGDVGAAPGGGNVAAAPPGVNMAAAPAGGNMAAAPPARDSARPRVSVARGRRRGCVSRDFSLRVRVADASPVVQGSVSLDGRRLRSSTEPSYSARIPVRRLSTGRHRIVVLSVDSAGNRTRRTLRFSRCARTAQRPRFTG